MKKYNKETSISYEVKEGDYIQVISPTGRQCSDFVAFDTRKLEKELKRIRLANYENIHG